MSTPWKSESKNEIEIGVQGEKRELEEREAGRKDKVRGRLRGREREKQIE